MTLTKIGSTNLDAFLYLLPGAPEEGQIAIGAIEDDYAAGAAVCSADDFILSIDHILVDPDFRRKGIGKSLLEEIEKIGKEAGFLGIEASFSSDTPGLNEFFQNSDWFLEEDTKVFCVPTEEFADSEPLAKLISGIDTGNVHSFSGLSDMKLRSLGNLLSSHTDTGVSLVDIKYDPRVSFALYNGSNEAEACLLTDRDGEDLTILYVTNFTDDMKNLLCLFAALKKTILEHRLTDGDIRFITVEPKMEALVKKIVPDKDYFENPASMTAARKNLV